MRNHSKMPDGSLTLCRAHFQGTCISVATDNVTRRQTAMPTGNVCRRELFPVRSPLLGESWLVSIPPLNNMLKFSGLSSLSSGGESIVRDY